MSPDALRRDTRTLGLHKRGILSDSRFNRAPEVYWRRLAQEQHERSNLTATAGGSTLQQRGHVPQFRFMNPCVPRGATHQPMNQPCLHPAANALPRSTLVRGLRLVDSKILPGRL